MTRTLYYGAAFLLLLLTLIIFPSYHSAGGEGICLPSPNLWQIPRFAGWLLNTLLLVLIVVISATANKRYNFIPGPEPVMSMGLALLLASNCLTSVGLSGSTIVLLFNTLALLILLSTYEARNATREFFLIATLPAIGSMFQVAFITLVPVYVAGGFLMKSFRAKELVAFIFGLAAPYWIAVGTGMVDLQSFGWPGTETVFGAEAVAPRLLPTLVACCIMGGVSIILTLYNLARLYTRNSRLRGMHGTFIIMGLMAIAGFLFNFDNFSAYYGLLALWLAIEVASLLHFYSLKNYNVALISLGVVFLALWIIEI